MRAPVSATNSNSALQFGCSIRRRNQRTEMDENSVNAIDPKYAAVNGSLGAESRCRA